MNSDPKYHSFMIRLWQEDRDEMRSNHWYVELESIQTGQKNEFVNLEVLFDFLRRQIDMEQN